MTDHRAVLAALPREDRTALAERSDWQGLRHLAGYLGALGVCSAIIVMQPPFWWLILLPQGILLVFLFTLSHEATHQTPFANRTLNEIVGHCIAPIIILPFLWFRYYHLAHHKHTNDPQNDPELAGHPRPGNWKSYGYYLTGIGYWTGMIKTLWASARGRFDAPYLPTRQHGSFKREAQIVLTVQLCALLSLLWSPLVLWLWIVPVLIGQPFLRLYLLAEHGLCPPVANMLENTRTTFTNRFVRWLAWNMPFHCEHHAAPHVPFHKLPALHRHMAAHLRSTSPSYTAFTKEYAAQLND